MFDRVQVQPRGVFRAARLVRSGGLQTIIIDVDGTLTDGKQYTDADGEKLFKAFGPDDHDAIKLALRSGIDVALVSADRRGGDISRARAIHMSLPMVWTDASARDSVLDAVANPSRTMYIGDGIHDLPCMRAAGFGIATHDAWPATRRGADAVTSRNGGSRAVAQAIDFGLRRLTCSSV